MADRDFEDIGKELGEFLRTTLEAVKPDWIFTVERKGTALLRAVVESREGAGPAWRGWERVLAHEALEDLDVSFLKDSIVLVLDDSIYSGRKLKDLLHRLSEKGVRRTSIKVAVFSVHEKCIAFQPDYYWFGQLEEDRYRKVRDAVIKHFQARGSLLLDTEHIEVPVDLNCSRVEFFEALSSAGTAVEHISGGGKVNLTIYNPTLLDAADFQRHLPAKTITEGVIRKVRIIERENNRYAMIPIFYPSVSVDIVSEDLESLGEPFSSLAGGSEKNFHLVGIFSALELFRTVCASLRDLVRQKKVWVRNPFPDDPEDCLSHLRVLFPGIDVNALHRAVQERIDAGLFSQIKKGLLMKKPIVDAAVNDNYRGELQDLKWALHRTVLRYSDQVPAGPRGALFSEVLESVLSANGKYGVDLDDRKALLSAAVDQTIDSAEIHADTTSIRFTDGICRTLRFLKADNEMVRAQVRRADAMWRSVVPWQVNSHLEPYELEY